MQKNSNHSAAAAELENIENGRRDAILDAWSGFQQFYDDLCDGQRDAYLDELEG